MLFCGRVTTADVITLTPFRGSGLIAPPRYVPPWRNSRAGAMAPTARHHTRIRRAGRPAPELTSINTQGARR